MEKKLFSKPKKKKKLVKRMALIYISTNCIMSDLIKDKWIFLCASRETFHQPQSRVIIHHVASVCFVHTREQE